jgi:SNF2 family DNA or RNA helicase
VFLLSHRAGAQGLTLVRASRVFLLEPALEPAIEQQAVARVHRIGQQRWVEQWWREGTGACLGRGV